MNLHSVLTGFPIKNRATRKGASDRHSRRCQYYYLPRPPLVRFFFFQYGSGGGGGGLRRLNHQKTGKKRKKKDTSTKISIFHPRFFFLKVAKEQFVCVQQLKTAIKDYIFSSPFDRREVSFPYLRRRRWCASVDCAPTVEPRTPARRSCQRLSAFRTARHPTAVRRDAPGQCRFSI